MDDQQRKLLSVLDTCWPSLHGLLVRLTLRPDAAEDLFQDLFVRLSHAEGFHRTADPAGYAHRAAINLAMDWRRARRRKTEARPLRFDLPAQEPPALERMIRQEELEQLLDALADLSDASRDAFVMRHLEGQTYEDVGRRMGKTAHQARALAHKAIRELRTLMNPGVAPGKSEVGCEEHQ